MKRILIINLRRFGDIFYSAQMIGGLLDKYPTAEIYYLTYQESVRAAHVFSQLQGLYTIDREKLGILLKGGPFSMAHAFKELRNCLQNVGFEWDLIVNISNCSVSAFLTSYLSHAKENYKGIRYSTNGTLEFSDDWIAWANEIMVDLAITPFSYMEIFQKSLEFNSNLQTRVELVHSKEHDISTHNVFSKLHDFRASEKVYVVALQLSASTSDKSASYEEAVQLIQNIFDHQNLYPLLLVGPSENERVFARKLNADLENTLFVVESDFIGLNSVLRTVDLLLTVDTSIKHLAAIQNTKLLELQFNTNLLFKMPANSGSPVVLLNREKIDHFQPCAQFIADCCSHIVQNKSLSLEAPAGASLFEYSLEHGFSLIKTGSQEIREMHAYYSYQRACVTFALELKLESMLCNVSKELLAEYREILSNILAAYREISQDGEASASKIFNAINKLEPANYNMSPFKTLLAVRKGQVQSRFSNDVESNRKIFKEFLLNAKDEFADLKQLIINKQGSVSRRVRIPTQEREEYEI
ncbi:MAG: glycosyltransferase family 9 protein [Bdellovibrio sp.]|nr:glycosyltransferase family 9 protein [Bdellovibrio sp.]